MSPPPRDRIAVSVAEAASLAGVSRAGLYRFVSSGELPSVHLGGRRLVRLQALEAFLAALEQGEQIGAVGGEIPTAPGDRHGTGPRRS